METQSIKSLSTLYEELHPHLREYLPSQIICLSLDVGRLKNAAQDKLHAADLIDLNVLEARLKGEVSSGE